MCRIKVMDGQFGFLLWYSPVHLSVAVDTFRLFILSSRSPVYSRKVSHYLRFGS